MRGCEWCDYKETEWLLYQSLYWSVYLADRQDYIGRCILVLNRHCGSLSELDISEWTELKTMIDRLERLYKEVLGAELCNWSCLLRKRTGIDRMNGTQPSGMPRTAALCFGRGFAIMK